MVLRISAFKRITNPSYTIKVKKHNSSHEDNVLRTYIKAPVLTPQEVTNILRANEYTKEFATPNSVKSYDSNQLASNDPIEDTRSEARCLLTNGILLGVYDGHGGSACAKVVSKYLLNYISACLLPPNILQKFYESRMAGENPQLIETFNDKTSVDEVSAIYEGRFTEFLKDLTKNTAEKEFSMEAAMENAFLRLDDDIATEALNALRDVSGYKAISVAVSGAVTAVAHIDGPHLHVANVGDCQVVLGTLSENDGWTAKMMSIEHNTDNRAEVERIYSEHPAREQSTVIKMERLLGQLAPLRSMGDFQYKWSLEIIEKVLLPLYGEAAIPPNYYTPPYLTAKPEVKYHRLTPKDKFLIIASDGLWDLISPLQAVRLVGQHMSGKVTLSPLRLPRPNVKLGYINDMLLQRKEGLKKKPLDCNAATHLLRNVLGGMGYGLDYRKISQILSVPSDISRLLRDDITITVVYMDSEFLRHCPP